MNAEGPFRPVRLIGIPVQLWARSRVWFEGLLREFDIIATESDEATPRELVAFVADTRERFSRFSTDSNTVLEESLERGDAAADLEMELPPEAGNAARELWVRIVAADDFCRHGDLLTLALPEDVRTFVRWYLGEFSNQMEGAEPSPWKGDDRPSTP